MARFYMHFYFFQNVLIDLLSLHFLLHIRMKNPSFAMHGIGSVDFLKANRSQSQTKSPWHFILAYQITSETWCVNIY